MIKLKFFYIVLLFLLLASVICTTSYSADTVLHYYRPFAGSEHHSTLKISKSMKGFCREQSHQIKREDAWRCYANGTLFDPCFIKGYGNKGEAKCITSPWTKKAFLLHLEYDVDSKGHKSLDMSRTYPWAVKLRKKLLRCLAYDNDGNFIEGLRVHYLCEDHSILMGHLQRCNPEWSILRYHNGKSEIVKIKSAWF